MLRDFTVRPVNFNVDVPRPLHAESALGMYRRGVADRRAQDQDFLRKQIGGAMAGGASPMEAADVAFAGGDIGAGIDLQSLSRDQLVGLMEWLPKAALAANDPQKWDMLMERARPIFGEDLDPYLDFSTRAALIQDATDFKTQIVDTGAGDGMRQTTAVTFTPEGEVVKQTPIGPPKAASSQTTVVMPGAKKLQEGLTNRYLEVEESASQAANTMNLYQTMDTLLSDPNIYTGAGGEAVQSLKKLGQTMFGLDFESVAGGEVAQKMTDELALQFKKQSADPQTSNFEREMYRRMATGLSDSEQGRKLLIQVRVADLLHEQRKAEVWRAHLTADNTIDPTVFKALASLEAERREQVGEFVAEAQRIAKQFRQKSPTAGADDLKRKYNLD